MTYRFLQNHETPFLREMLYEALYVPKGQPPFPTSILDRPEILKYIKNWGQKLGDVAIVLGSEGELIAAIWGRRFVASEKGYGFIDEQTPEISMAVKSGFRGKGIGTKLIERISEEYQRLGYSVLSLSVDELNPAKNLYERMGFFFFEENGTAVTMKKDLLK